MKHYGLWNEYGWMLLDTGQVFWTTSLAVAKAQLEFSNSVGVPPWWEIKEFEDAR